MSILNHTLTGSPVRASAQVLVMPATKYAVEQFYVSIYDGWNKDRAGPFSTRDEAQAWADAYLLRCAGVA